MDLLTMFRSSIGDLSTSTDMDSYYQNFLDMAKNELITDDISDTIIETETGKLTTVLYAQLLMNDKDIATNPSLLLLRNKLSTMTKGERVEEE